MSESDIGNVSVCDDNSLSSTDVLEVGESSPSSIEDGVDVSRDVCTNPEQLHHYIKEAVSTSNVVCFGTGDFRGGGGDSESHTIKVDQSDEDSYVDEFNDGRKLKAFEDDVIPSLAVSEEADCSLIEYVSSNDSSDDDKNINYVGQSAIKNIVNIPSEIEHISMDKLNMKCGVRLINVHQQQEKFDNNLIKFKTVRDEKHDTDLSLQKVISVIGEETTDIANRGGDKELGVTPTPASNSCIDLSSDDSIIVVTDSEFEEEDKVVTLTDQSIKLATGNQQGLGSMKGDICYEGAQKEETTNKYLLENNKMTKKSTIQVKDKCPVLKESINCQIKRITQYIINRNMKIKLETESKLSKEDTNTNNKPIMNHLKPCNLSSDSSDDDGLGPTHSSLSSQGDNCQKLTRKKTFHGVGDKTDLKSVDKLDEVKTYTDDRYVNNNKNSRNKTSQKKRSPMYELKRKIKKSKFNSSSPTSNVVEDYKTCKIVEPELPVSFKIPKRKFSDTNSPQSTTTNQLVRYEGRIILLRQFLAQEQILPEVDIESFMSGKHKFDDMFRQVNPIKNCIVKKTIKTDDTTEMKDLRDRGWDTFKDLHDDKERVRFAQNKFQNHITSDPSRNLTVHGFRRSLEGKLTLPHLSTQRFMVETGKQLTLRGYKTKGEGHTNTNQIESSASNKKIKYSDFVACIKAVFFKKYEVNVKNKVVSSDIFDSFKTYLGHYKAGQEETANFLSFYNTEMELDELQTKEVIDLENQFSMIPNFYGETESMLCPTCDKKHKFSQ